MSLFEKAKDKGVKKKTAAPREIYIIEDPEFEKEICTLADLNRRIAELQAEQKVVASTIRERGIDKFAEVYESKEKFPGSMQIKAGNGEFMIIPTDRYIGIDKDAAEDLKEAVSEDLIEETTTYVMDTKLVEKYGATISDLIENCPDIPDEDKENLIDATVKYSIKKGTISDLKTKYSDTPIKEMLEIIKPVYQVKNIKDVSVVEVEA